MLKVLKVVATVEARMGSTRLPGKTMTEILPDKPLIEIVIERLSKAKTVDEVVVATSVNQKDDIIERFCKKRRVPCFRGSEDDVLDRVYKAAKKYKADIIVQAGADCPFYDPDLVDELVNIYKKGNYDYVANDMKLTYPEGVDAHIMSMKVLEEIANKATKPRDREDVPRYIWEHPETYKIFNLEAPKELRRPDIRLTLDYEEDLILTREIYKALYQKNPDFRTIDVIKLLDENPELKKINEQCEQRSAAYIHD